MFNKRKTITALVTLTTIAACAETGDDFDKLELHEPLTFQVLELGPDDPVPERPYQVFTPDITLAPETTAVTQLDVANALGVPGATVDWGTSDLQGLDVLTNTGSDMPTEGTDYLAISSGLVSAAYTPNNAGNTSGTLGGLNTNAGQDMVQVSVTFPVPEGYNCWIVDWKFFSEEYPEWVGTAFNDAFLIEDGTSNISISGTTVTAPNNKAFDENGDLVTINTTGALGMTAANALGTTYDGATTLLTTRSPIDPGTTDLTLIFSIMDLGDSVYDSTAFIDNIRLTADPTCQTETVPNQSPTADAGADVFAECVDGGAVVQLDGSGSTDPEGEALAYSWDATGIAFDDATSVTPTATFPSGTTDVTLTVTDSESASDTDTVSVTVTDTQAPQLTLLGDNPLVAECGYPYVDPGAEATDVCGPPLLSVNDGVDSSTPGIYQVEYSATDGAGNVTSDSRTVEVVDTEAPVVSAISGPSAPVPAGDTVDLSATFDDLCGPHDAQWDWGDGTTSVGTLTPSGSGGSVDGSHAYTTPGVYTVVLTVTDASGNVGESVFQYVVVYDPDAGFVTGGGWFDSPAGAYTADAGATGKANFGFVSKYKKGATVPTGQTQFVFQAGDLKFHSTAYEWLVIAGARAQYKGTGTVNGGGSYGFILTATDGDQPGGGGTDRIRVKIWELDGAVVYDNQIGADDGAAPNTDLGGGSIVIHKK